MPSREWDSVRFSLELLQQQRRWQIKFMISLWCGVCSRCKNDENKKAEKMKWKEIAWAATPRMRSRAVEEEGLLANWLPSRNRNGTRERHKNKFAIIHFDLSSGMRIGKASRGDTASGDGSGWKKFKFAFSSFAISSGQRKGGRIRYFNVLHIELTAFLFALTLVMGANLFLFPIALSSNLIQRGEAEQVFFHVFLKNTSL